MNTKEIKQVIDLFENSKVHKMEIEAGEMKIKLEKEDTKAAFSSSAAQTDFPKKGDIDLADKSGDENVERGRWVKAPLVGTFYSKPNENSSTFVNVGDKVKKGDTLCIIEAMKVMNEVKAPCEGTVIGIEKQDGEMVQFEDNLICIGD
ncbi:biotin/lipoyl-containing protein [Anaerofustis sp.]|uniref:acetyl-CoA carboxylase biotin carboxyl carrier protein n=1 Tax=Anaerofustis sp. TaxID=1872517 RepID=UPI0025C277B1|nr:biotin/lipoyl-containing protein [Anaerofustis sp.]